MIVRPLDSKEILIVAGESSADAHAAALVRELKSLHPAWSFYGVGGPRMKEAGVEILVPMSRVTVMGFGEVIPKLIAVRAAMRALVDSVLHRLPDAAILLDFPDFNLRLAGRLRAFPIPILYYISPQLWAWREGRVDLIRRRVDKMMVILPFEKEFYARHGIDVDYVGHPLLDQLPGDRAPTPRRGEVDDSQRVDEPVGSWTTRRGGGEEPPLLALLPGSRHQEVERCLPVMLDTVSLLRSQGLALDACACLADSVRSETEGLCAARGMKTTSQDKIGEVLSRAEAALVVSGTATLHCALYDVPMVILYKTSWLNYAIAKCFVHVPHIGLVNLVAGEPVAPEMIQGRARPTELAAAIGPILRSGEWRRELRGKLAAVREKLGPPGASRRAAEIVSRFLAEYCPPTSPSPTGGEGIGFPPSPLRGEVDDSTRRGAGGGVAEA